MMMGVVILGLILSGCAGLKNENSQTVSQQDKDSVATIERQEAGGGLTSAEAAMEKDSLKQDPILKF